MLNFLLFNKNTKVFLQTLLLGLQYHNIHQNLWNIVVHIKFHLSLLLTITTFLISPLLSLKAGCFSPIFSVCQTTYVPDTS